MIIHWIWLTQLPFIGSVTARRLIEKLGDAEKIYQAGSEQLAEISDLSVRQRESRRRQHKHPDRPDIPFNRRSDRCQDGMWRRWRWFPSGDPEKRCPESRCT